MSVPSGAPLSVEEILELVRRRAEVDLAKEGERLTILDVYLPMPSDVRKGEWTVMARWERSDLGETDDAIYTLSVKDGKYVQKVFGPEW